MMKKAFAVLVVALCALPMATSAQSATDPAKMVQIFSNVLKTDGGNFQVIILNDRTVDALFGTSPAKIAIRTKARMTTVLFVQGTPTKDFEFDPATKVEQKGETLDGKPTSMKNFTKGKIANGESVQGTIERRAADLYVPFKVTMGDNC